MKCPRKNCEYDTATQPAANMSQQSELELLRSHAVVVHLVGYENVVFGCFTCRVKCYPLSAGVETVLCENSIHDQNCDGAYTTMGPGRKVKLEEWVMYLRMLATAGNYAEVVVEPMQQCKFPGCQYDTSESGRQQSRSHAVKKPCSQEAMQSRSHEDRRSVMQTRSHADKKPCGQEAMQSRS